MAKPGLTNIYDRSVIIRSLYWSVVNFISAIIVLFLYILKPFKFVKLFLLVDERIGHLADHTELLLRRIQLGVIKSKGITFIGIAGRTPANKQLMKMFKRRIKIVQIPKPEILRVFLRSIFSEKSLFGKSIFYQPLTVKTNEYYEFGEGKPSLSFTPEEEVRGTDILRKLGIPEGSWFVCFHSRDPVYLFKKYGAKISAYDIRDCSVKNFLKAAKYIAARGGYAVRMGSAVSEKLPDLKDPRIIDYANSPYRSDFGDIFLTAKCKFFLGCTAGLWAVPTIFNVPIAGTNFFNFHTPYKKIDLFLPKKVWSKKKKRFLTIREILDWQRELGHPAGYATTENVERAGLEVIENTPEEIYGLAKEINERLDGKWKNSTSDEKLQKKFHSLIKPSHNCYGTPAHIGAKFLRENKNLLE